MHIDTYPLSSNLQTDNKNQTPDDNKIDFAQFSAVLCFYSVCFSTITSCTYWKSHTLHAIAEHAIHIYEKAFNEGNKFTCDWLPQVINISGVDINVVFDLLYESILVNNCATSKLTFKNLILKNNTQHTGFLLWLPNCCLSCIFQHNAKQKTKYFLVWCNQQQTVNLFEQFCDTDFLINMIYDVATQDEACGVIECKLQFLSCLTQATKSEKQKALKKHKTTTQKKVHCNKIQRII